MRPVCRVKVVTVYDLLLFCLACVPGCYRLPLFAKLDPAREAHRAAVRSRRLGHAMWVSDMMDADAAEPGKHFPPTTQFDMVRG